MKTLETLCQQLSQGEFELSRPAFRRAVERNINATEIRQAGANAEIIEDYPNDSKVTGEQTSERDAPPQNT